jgi:hypothetical protein
VLPAPAASPARRSGAPGTAAPVPWIVWHPSGAWVSRCEGAIGRGSAQTHEGVLLQRVYQLSREPDGAITARKLVSMCRLVSGLRGPLDGLRVAYEEKTCCLTSEEGFEFSAPMVLSAWVRNASAMMRLLEEVGAQALAEEKGAMTKTDAIGAECSEGRELRQRLEPAT